MKRNSESITEHVHYTAREEHGTTPRPHHFRIDLLLTGTRFICSD